MYGNKLKQIRKHFDATQDGMANFLGISARTYASYERDENNPPYSMLVMLCKNHNINLNWFIADMGDVFNQPEAQQDEQLENLVARIVDKKMKEKGL